MFVVAIPQLSLLCHLVAPRPCGLSQTLCLCTCSGHQSFSSNKKINDLVGNITHSSILVPYHGWRISHRTHHSNHGHVENDESWHPVSKKLYDRMVRYGCTRSTKLQLGHAVTGLDTEYFPLRHIVAQLLELAPYCVLSQYTSIAPVSVDSMQPRTHNQ